MKTVRKGDDIKRVSNIDAERLIKNGWNYIPKNIWKKNIRDYDVTVSSKKEKENKNK